MVGLGEGKWLEELKRGWGREEIGIVERVEEEVVWVVGRRVFSVFEKLKRCERWGVGLEKKKGWRGAAESNYGP
jgi:hypothetical protein